MRERWSIDFPAFSKLQTVTFTHTSHPLLVSTQKKNSIKTFIFIAFALSTLVCHAQPSNFNTQRNWSISKKELSFGGGVTQFAGDLGGVNKLSSNYRISDLTWPSTGWNIQTGYRYRFHPYYATKSRIEAGQLRGNDALKTTAFQQARNLHFRSFYIELSQRFECIVLARERLGCTRFSIPGRSRKFYQLYVYAGAGLLYFNPQAKYNGTWVDLQPLKTEGQGLPDGPKPYKRLTASVPLGLGFQFEIKRFWRMGVELEYTPTFSDYLDDVGGVYYDESVLAAQIGQVSADLSNPSAQHQDWFQTGMNRGNARSFDSYFSFSVFLSRNITYWRYNRKAVTKESGVSKEESKEQQ